MGLSISELTGLIRTFPTSAALLDREGRYLEVSPRWCDVHGLQAEAVHGRLHLEVFPETESAWRAARDAALAGDVKRIDAVELHRADEEPVFVDWVVGPCREEAGEIIGLLVHAGPATDRERILRRLGEQEALVRALFDKSPVGLNLCRLDGLWVESNPAFLEIIGYSQEEADGGLTYWELTPSEYDDDEKVQLASLESTGRYGPYEKEFIRKDGSRIPVRLNGFIIERDGEKFIWSLIEDISAQRDLEAALRHQQAAAEQSAKLASIGEMAAGVAHEINNPLQIIEAAAYELQLAQRDGGPAPLDAIEAIRSATERAASIVRGLRKFGREDTTEAELIAVESLIDDALLLTQERFRSHGVSLHVDVSTKRAVRCTPLELSQVLVNLLGNAFDVVRADRGEIWLEARDDGEAHVVIAVADSGPGVPEALRERVFEPFFTTKPVGTGMGLGLSISRRIVTALGGAMSYQTAPRSAFVVRLPCEGISA